MGASATSWETLWATGKKDEVWLIKLCWFKMLVKLKLSLPAFAVPPTYMAERPRPPLRCRSVLVCVAWWEGP